MGKRALITGVTGQDGAYLSQLLLGQGYEVIGTVRPNGQSNTDRLKTLNIVEQVQLLSLNLLDPKDVISVLKKVKPDEVYNLAAQSSVAASFKEPVLTGDFNGLGVARILDAIKAVNQDIKFYQASTSELFGNVEVFPQNENTSFAPCNPYAISKLYAHQMSVYYREAFGLFCCAGILYNHESPLRGKEYVTRKITRRVAEIKKGIATKLSLGNLDVQRDWGYAPEYVEAMWLMMHRGKPDDYIISTGELHSIREFVEKAFAHVGLNWQDHVIIDQALYRPTEVKTVVGDSTKARSELNWRPTTSFDDLVKIMVDADMHNVGV